MMKYIFYGQVLGKVRKTVTAHVPMEDTSGVVSHISENLSENQENSSLLAVDMGLL